MDKITENVAGNPAENFITEDWWRESVNSTLQSLSHMTLDERKLHDKLLQLFFTYILIAVAFLKKALSPPIVGALDWSKLTIDKRDFVDGRTFRESMADMIYTVPLLGHPDQEVRLCLILEHKSYDDPMTVVQLSHYVDQFMLREESRAREAKRLNRDFKFPLLMTMILHHGRTPFTGRLELVDMFPSVPDVPEFAEFLPHLKAHLYDLSVIDTDDLPDDPNVPELNLVLRTLKAVNETGKQCEIDTEACFRQLASYIKVHPERKDLIMCILIYFLQGSNLGREWFTQHAFPHLSQDWSKDMPTVLEEILTGEYEKGRSEGETAGYSRGQDEGYSRGQNEGRRALIGSTLRILQRKFDELPQNVVDHLNGMTDIVALESINVEAIECKTLDEFIKGL